MERRRQLAPKCMRSGRSPHREMCVNIQSYCANPICERETLFYMTQPIWALRWWSKKSLCRVPLGVTILSLQTSYKFECSGDGCVLDTWQCSVIGPLCEAVKSRRRGDAFVVPANSALRLRSLALTVWSCGPTNGNDEIRRRCARRVVPTCPRRHTLLSGHKKTPQRFSNFGQSSQNANSLLKRLLGPRKVHVSVSKEESTRSLRIVCRFRLEQQASCTFACCATQSKLTSFGPTSLQLLVS